MPYASATRKTANVVSPAKHPCTTDQSTLYRNPHGPPMTSQAAFGKLSTSETSSQPLPRRFSRRSPYPTNSPAAFWNSTTSRGDPRVYGSPKYGVSGVLFQNEESGKSAAGIPVTWWTRIPAYPCSKVGAPLVVCSRMAWLSVSPGGWSLVASQSAWPPLPPEKKLNVGDRRPLSASA